MLATAWPEPFDDPDWVYELKWDGVRCVLSSIDGPSRLHSRRGLEMSAKYPEVAQADIPTGLVLDGEIVALDEAGNPSFELLQGRMNTVPAPGRAVAVHYIVFDLLYAGEPLIDAPLEERVGRLAELELPAPFVPADRFPSPVGPVWDFVRTNDLEGVVAKRSNSRYLPGTRSPDWRKIGNFKQLRAVVGGFTPGTGGRTGTFGALMLGLIDGNRLRWIGAVGSGFDDRELRLIREALDQMTTGESPFAPDDGMPPGVVWVEPRLVAMVRYKQWTQGGKVRAPSFKGFTDDAPAAVTWDAEGPELL